MKYVYIFVVLLFAAIAVYHLNSKRTTPAITKDSITVAFKNDTIKPVATPSPIPVVKDSLPVAQVTAGNLSADSLVSFAETLIGTPYKYACTNPSEGFDCSGFITYVFNHFGVSVPRSSVDFTNVGTEVPVNESRKGDLILFTGTDSTVRVVGHMGIVISNSAEGLQFIHSSSGKAMGVTVTPLNDYYKGRFVKVIRVLKSS